MSHNITRLQKIPLLLRSDHTEQKIRETCTNKAANLKGFANKQYYLLYLKEVLFTEKSYSCVPVLSVPTKQLDPKLS